MVVETLHYGEQMVAMATHSATAMSLLLRRFIASLRRYLTS